MTKYEVTLAELERSAHVPREQQVEEEPTHPPRQYLAPEELDRQRLLGTLSAGRVTVT
jgi:hypothetical protein